jgi:hypothetical protein
VRAENMLANEGTVPSPSSTSPEPSSSTEPPLRA